MNKIGEANSHGDLGIKVNGKNPGLMWKFENYMLNKYGFDAATQARKIARETGIPVIITSLRAILTRENGDKIDYGLLSERVVTDVGADKIAKAFNGAVGYTLSNFNYHGVGTGTTAEAAGDTALVTESTTVLNPDSTRATGTQSNPASKQYRSVGTVTFDGSAAITEHGIFSQAATGGGDLLDRSVFSAINVASGDSIQFTYTLSIVSGS